MRVLLKRLISVTNISMQRYAVRLCSSDSQAKAAVKDKPEEHEPKESEKIEVQKKNVVVEKFGQITTLNIDRQPTRNSLDIATLQEMTEAINAFDKDPEAKVLVFNGEGGSFCSGFNMNDIGTVGYHNLKDAAMRLERRPLCDKITIAAVSGYAVAEGFELALSCDLRVIEDTAILGCLGRRFGVPQSLFGARKLTSLIGLSPALDLLITGRLITGVDAHRLGLACKLTSTGTALGEAIKLAKSLVKFPSNAMVMDKMAAINSQLNPNSEESMRDEAIMNSLLGNAIEDMKEGVKKFQAGIGKHGKFYKLTEVELKDWELEETSDEVTIKIKQKEKEDNIKS
ncbi:probable enoyl-CoA hydratase [Helicoverpa armigera]|uniref:probable enoyl-CoA hydratase n=1 Tax=Helicoverpa armigera TaxID=29058 RepID=UPI003083806B